MSNSECESDVSTPSCVDDDIFLGKCIKKDNYFLRLVVSLGLCVFCVLVGMLIYNLVLTGIMRLFYYVLRGIGVALGVVT